MIIVDSFESVPDFRRPLILTIGNFDGLHRGHKKVVRKVMARAREAGGTSAMLTFEPHPRMLLHPDNAPPLILTREEKIEIVSRWGVELYIEVHFTVDFASMTAEAFLENLFGLLAPEEIYIGADFRFGVSRKGGIEVLKRFALTNSSIAEAVPKLRMEGEEVSATSIRKHLLKGEVDKAHALLGRPFEVRNFVVKGAQRGRSLGFPTANINLKDKISPSPGVYVTAVDLGEDYLLPSVSNLGAGPTFGEKAEPILETHVLKGEYQLYGKKMRCLFFTKLRDEKKFDKAEELTAQIKKDKNDAEKYFKLNPLIKKAFY